MQTPVREQVLAALFAAMQAGLAADGGPAIATIERNRRPENQKFPAVFQVDVDQDDDIREELSVDRITATVLLEGQVQAETDADLGPALNLLEARVITVAFANPLLDGIAVNMTRGSVERAMDREGSTPTASFSAALMIEFSTESGKPFVIGH